jgi:hypothetical protein
MRRAEIPLDNLLKPRTNIVSPSVNPVVPTLRQLKEARKKAGKCLRTVKGFRLKSNGNTEKGSIG